MKDTLFWIVIICEILLGAGLILTLIVPRLHVWPPPGRQSWQYGYTWILTIISMLGTIVLGLLDWNHFALSHPMRFVLGTVMVIIGLAFSLWGMTSLGLRTTQGLDGAFVVTGAYQYSRNPQYVGAIISFAGYALLCNSTHVSVTVVLGIMLFLLTPFTEESWLRKRFGNEYDDYVRRVPRFVSFGRPRGE
jgi:protein-S-isoprenylcysteine O-methyltransferase Ste14